MKNAPAERVDKVHQRPLWFGRFLSACVSGEWLTAVGATAAAIYLHILNARSVGALWRDETHTATAAIRPTLREIWSSLETDNFPLFSTLVVRSWGWSEWGRSDEGLRWLGALIGIGILAALWWNAWRIHRAPPTIALALWAFNPIAIRFGDSIRPYGCGILLQLLAAGCMARLATAPSWPRFVSAALACTLCVQCLYQNAIFVLAFGVAGCVIAVRARCYRIVIPTLGAGAVAAISLLPYLPSIWASRDWGVLMEDPTADERFWSVLQQALGGDNRVVFGIVVLVSICALSVALICLASRQLRLNRDAADRSIFAMVAGTLGAVGFIALLHWMNLGSQTWHCLPLLASMAFACDVILGHARQAAILRATLLIAVLLLSWNLTVGRLQTRLTNIDTIAAALQESAAPGDLIVVQPWFYGVTFQRYYHGEAAWVSLPELSDLSVHRYDLVKRAMASPDAVDRVTQRITSTLLAGHRVWIVGGLPGFPPGYLYGTTPTAPHPQFGWQHVPYMITCGWEVSAMIDRLAARRAEVVLPQSEQVESEERVRLTMADGWKR